MSLLTTLFHLFIDRLKQNNVPSSDESDSWMGGHGAKAPCSLEKKENKRMQGSDSVRAESFRQSTSIAQTLEYILFCDNSRGCLLWACTETGQAVIQKLLDRFEVGRLGVGIRHFCGKQFDREEQDIRIDVADNTTRATYIDVGKSRNVEEKITPGEEKYNAV